LSEWADVDSEIGRAVDRYSSEALAAYREAPRWIEEHANLERAAVEGGYGRRQLFELIQNGADELVGDAGRVEVVLTKQALYCANEGRPLTTEGVGALLSSHLSSKRGVEIGRFGLGFKSVLGITRRPEIFSRAGSIRFDPDDAAERIRSVVAAADRTPVLRLATAVDPNAAAREDPVLAELMKWATTVVRLRRDTADSSWLSNDLRSFPEQFLVFSPHVSALVLGDRENGVRRSITSRRDDNEFVLEEDAMESRWRVFAAEHQPTENARLDAGAMAERERIPLVWAVPTRRGRRGEFWAFFPTLDQTTLSGVVNAPWKLNEDRTRIIEGPFNLELIQHLGALVIENLPSLCPPDDPGVLLELMPARGREAAGWADAELTEFVNELATRSQTIPDQEATLRSPRRINLHPAQIPRDVLDTWAEQPNRPADWVHPSAETRDRRARVELYMDDKPASGLDDWLQALLAESDPLTGSIAAVTVAAKLAETVPDFLPALRNTRIVLDDSGMLVAPSTSGLFCRSSIPIDIEAHYVDHALEKAVGGALETLGVHQVDPELALEARLRAYEKTWSAADWDLFWEVARMVSPQAVVGAVERSEVAASRLKARSCDGQYRWLASLLLPGAIIREGSVDDATVVLDTHFHRTELRAIELLGVPSGPSRNGGSTDEPWFTGYRREAVEAYLERLRAGGGAPNRDLLDFRVRPFAGPLSQLVGGLSDQSRAAYTAAVLRVSDNLAPWVFGHQTMVSRYPEMEWPNPVVSMLRRYGLLDTSLGRRQLPATVGPGLSYLKLALPVADIPSLVARTLGVPDDIGALTDDQWESAFETTLSLTDEATIGTLYAAAASTARDAPPELRARVGRSYDLRPPEAVVAVADPALARVLADSAEAFIQVDTADDQRLLVERWGLKDANDEVRSEVLWTSSGEAEPLADAYPMLRSRLAPAQRLLQLQPCDELQLERFTATGRVGEQRSMVVYDGTIYFKGTLEPSQLLNRVSDALGLGLDRADIDAVLRNLDEQRVQLLRTAIRGAGSDTERLLLAVGVDELRARLPRATLQAVEALEGELDDRAIADLALVVHGTRVLQEHADILDSKGLEAPVAWGGKRRAVSFVRDLGFPIEYAGFESSALERILEVDGPPDIGPLHDYQITIVSEIRGLIQGSNGRRGLLSLPTGAGKTRVTIEALIAAVTEGHLKSPVLWVAQTEELCEQAVQTWSELWRGKGPRGRLTISRLWGHFEAQEAEHGEQVVVATIQKLAAGVFSKDSYEWLKRAGCLVVDEAHTSIGPMYTRLLDWQGLSRNRARVPLIGLTATPFRGTNLEETKRLVGRYGNKRLDLTALGGTDAYPELQRIGILAKVDHELLPGSDIQLNKEELESLNRFSQLPDAALRRLAADINRNRTLLESITALNVKWPVLVFCVSVEHAQTMAALLNRDGIPAASITANTEKSARRYYIDKFRNGRLRVLTNYNVLAAGFDAPKVRALYVARPTYAPNAYQQMIGRGLRGPRNGGTERCLLVNVADNVAQYGEALAFHDFEYVWEPQTPNGSG
jgi:superfamily II DNA or RNA helicase